MPGSDSIATEIHGLDVVLEGDELVLYADGDALFPPYRLIPEYADRLRIEMAKAQLWEWNRYREQKARSGLRYRRYLGSWLVMCLAAFSAYLGYPGYVLPVFFVLLSAFLWWRAGYEEQRADQAAKAQRSAFRPEWDYIRERLEEVEAEP